MADTGIAKAQLTPYDQQNKADTANAFTVTFNPTTLKVTYTLTDMSGKTVTSGVETGISAYNVLPSSPQASYGTLAAQQDADKRAAEDIAERIRLDLNVYFAKR